MSQLNSSSATHISPKILCQYLPILVWSGAYAPGRRCRRKTSEKNPFFRNSRRKTSEKNPFFRNSKQRTYVHTLPFLTKRESAHKCYFWNKFQKCLLGNIPKPLQNAAGAFCKNVVKNWKAFAKILDVKKIFLRRFFINVFQNKSWTKACGKISFREKSCVMFSDVL